MRRLTAFLTVAGLLAMAPAASAHNAGGLVWDARGTAPTVECGQGAMIVAQWWRGDLTQMGAIGGYPNPHRCDTRINSSAVRGRSWAMCNPGYWCRAWGVHRWTLDRDASRAGWPGAVLILTTEHL